jgi:protein TonB
MASASRTPVPAVPISRVSPVYPELAIRARTSGSVVLDLQIDKSGRVVKATPVEGPSVFYDAAVKAVMKWRYKPATIGEANVASKTRVTMVFNLER